MKHRISKNLIPLSALTLFLLVSCKKAGKDKSEAKIDLISHKELTILQGGTLKIYGPSTKPKSMPLINLN